MRLVMAVGVVLGLSLLAGGAAAFWKATGTGKNEHNPVESAVARHANQSAPLGFAELLDPGPKLKPSSKALALQGKRVTLVGFMAEMETPMRGGFCLVPRPISLDESGAGTGDLPLESVFVVVPGAEGRVIPHVNGALEGTGILEVGNQTDAEGHVSNFRLRLDSDQRLSATH
jgi:hypothetical protein